MKCPHCDVGIHESFQKQQPFIIGHESWTASYQKCPECTKTIVRLCARAAVPPGQFGKIVIEEFLAYPKNISSRPLPAEVPDPYKKDFQEAAAVLPLSPKASAALSRRNLQAVLRDKGNTTSKDLFDQIEEVIKRGTLPSHIADGLHAVRNIGNFAAHEIKSKVTGAIQEVEPGEAEWNLDVLEFLFDFYFVETAKAQKRKDELNKKLVEAGKPPIP
jgi:hypothetical protein